MKALKKKAKAQPNKKVGSQLKKLESLSADLKYFFISIGEHTFRAPTSKLKEILRAAEGKLIELPQREDLTTQEAADLLNVSRPYITNLIDEKKLKGFMVGNHRRVKKTDALEYKVKMRQEQGTAMDELAVESQKLGLDF